MANTTYDQFVTAANNAGLYDQFSEWDIGLAKRNPAAGMQLLSYKQDWNNATTDEGRALASKNAEKIRNQYGGYTGGADGSSFALTGNIPEGGSFAYTGDSVMQYAKDKGVYDQLSPEDVQLIQTSPTHGMGVVSGKVEAANGNLEVGRSMAEQSRMLGGGYTTNPDGTGYYKMMPTPADYVRKETPTYTNNYAGEIEDAYKAQKNYGDFSYDVEKPTFQSQYSDEMQNLMSRILNRGEFSYNAENDPLYSQYKKQYLREGQRASADALGAAAAATGGIPSSYAATAAAQAGNYYAAQLTDKIPELYQLAYNQYLNDAQMDRTNLQLLGDMDDRDYSRYMDDVSQWNTDRNFAYGVYGDKYNRLGTNLETARALEKEEYGRYRDDVDQTNKENEFDYKQYTDNIGHLTDEREYRDGREDAAFEKQYLLDELGLEERKQTHTEANDGRTLDLTEKEIDNNANHNTRQLDIEEKKINNEESYNTRYLDIEQQKVNNDAAYKGKALENEGTQLLAQLITEIGSTLYNGGKGDATPLYNAYNKILEMNPNLATVLPTPEALQASAGTANGGMPAVPKADTSASGTTSSGGGNKAVITVETLKDLFPGGVINTMSDWEYVEGIVGGSDKMKELGFTYDNPLTH